MTGNGGLAGDALDAPTNPDRTSALTNGFVMARTNTGHDARKEPSGSFILSNPQKAIDYAYRAVHVTAETAKAIATDYYAQPITFSYWNSCSNGGRQGLLEAQRFPDDFDGIVANAPWVDQTGFTIGAIWNQKALTEAPVSLEKMKLVADKAMAKCDEVDGLKDGLIDDPRKCSFDPARDVPACRPAPTRADCLTAAQAAAVKKVYSGPVSNGKPFFPGFMVGSEAVNAGPNGVTASGWANAIVAAQPGAKPADFNLAEGVMRYLVLDPPQPEYDTMKLDYDRDGEDGRTLEQAGRREGSRSLEVPEERRQIDHDLRLGGPDSPAVDGREVLRGRRCEERQGHTGLRAAVHGAGHGALRRRRRSRSQRCRDGRHRLGGEGQGARPADRQQGDERTSRAHPAALPVPAGCALQGAGQHRRRSQLQLRRAALSLRASQGRV